MLLTHARVRVFKSITDSELVLIDPQITALVGQNESGKTAFLNALYKARAIEPNVKYDVVEEYPRSEMTMYQRYQAREKNHNPAVVAELHYSLGDDDIAALNTDLGFELLKAFSFVVSHNYNNTSTISLDVPEDAERAFVQHLIEQTDLPAKPKKQLTGTTTLRELLDELGKVEGIDAITELHTQLSNKFTIPDTAAGWKNPLEYYVWRWLAPRIPKFLYFDEYYVLPGKVNLPELQKREQQGTLQPEDNTVLSLLRMAGVTLEELITTKSYEKARANLESTANYVSDVLFKYWTQTNELQIQFDIKEDPTEQPGFDEGSNLYIRIYHTRHRVSLPFNQRSKGFIWFFSFLVWFDSIEDALKTNNSLILLLDEPGLNLHALAQRDLLRYMVDLSAEHQVLYTTHSPFMVDSNELQQVRTVEDKPKEGTKITSNISSSDPRTLFPLQAALGYTIAQNLFIASRNLLVEGVADLMYLQFFSTLLEQQGRTSLRDDITIVPVGGLDKVATFVALLHANELELAILHDYNNKPDARLESLVREKLIRNKQVLNYAMFRSGNPAKSKATAAPSLNSDVEDLLTPKLYLELFNNAYSKELGGTQVTEADLPTGERIVERLGEYLRTNNIRLKQDGGFNHYLVARWLGTNQFPPKKIDAATLDRFEALIIEVNRLFGS